MISKLIAAGAALAVSALALQGGTAALAVGDAVPADRKFNDVMWNWDGAEGIHDYLGEPVLIDFWGKT